MLSSKKLGVGLTRLVPAAALLAALLVPLVIASADEDCPPGGCPIAPPQSREVNPSPARGDGSAVEVPKAAELPPVEITVHVLAPTFVEPAPVGASFGAVSIPVRYQSQGDASCGVQALGMAMDALPGAAPTSASLLGLLEDNGMMYDFGTGVEELAFAAQSFGYTGSFGFHGASMDQLRGQLATGSPVVVDLGANGESEPGHFVTVTGVSPDGEWVAYNDPTLGEQVISVSEFERSWGLQGNSGVVVATEPPPAAGVDTGALSLWVAFAAGVMALVSTTPLAKFRQGIGGMLDAGGGGSYTSARSAPKSSPPAKEKEKEKEPKKSKARFDEEIVGVTTPPKATSSVVTTPSEARAAQANAASKVVATPTELRAAQDPPDRGERRSVVYTPTQATQGTPREEQEDPDPTPKVVQTPGPTLTPSPRDHPDDSGIVIPTATPGPDTQSIAAVVTQTPEMDVIAAIGPPCRPGDYYWDDLADWVGTDGRTYAGYTRAGTRAAEVVSAARQVEIIETGPMVRIYGPQSARSALGFNRMTNWIGAGNVDDLPLSPAGAARSGLLSWGTVASLGVNIVADTALYSSGEYDRHEYAAALTVDTGTSIASVLVAGAVAGLVSGALVGASAGAVAIPLVGSVPGAVVGGVVGAIAGVATALVLNYMFSRSGARATVVDEVADMYRDWTGDPPAEGSNQ